MLLLLGAVLLGVRMFWKSLPRIARALGRLSAICWPKSRGEPRHHTNQDGDDRREQHERQKDQRDQGRSQSRPQQPPVRDAKYYGAVLGLRGSVTFEDVKRRYRELVVQYHPDKVNHLGPKLRHVAEEEMKDINEAFAFFEKRYGDN